MVTKSPTKKSAKKSSATAAKVPPVRKLTAAEAAQYKTLLGEMQRARKGESFAFDRYWEAIDEILFRELWRADKTVTKVSEWLAAHTGESTAVAYKNCRVARHATGEDIALYRPSKIDAALRYIETRDDHTLPRKTKVNLRALLVPVLVAKKSVMRSLEHLTVEQLEAATVALLPKESRSKPSPSEAALNESFAKRKSLAGASASVRDGVLTVKNVPLTSVSDLIAALRELD